MSCHAFSLRDIVNLDAHPPVSPFPCGSGFAIKEPIHVTLSAASGLGVVETVERTPGFFVIPIKSGFLRMTYEARPLAEKGVV